MELLRIIKWGKPKYKIHQRIIMRPSSSKTFLETISHFQQNISHFEFWRGWISKPDNSFFFTLLLESYPSYTNIICIAMKTRQTSEWRLKESSMSQVAGWLVEGSWDRCCEVQGAGFINLFLCGSVKTILDYSFDHKDNHSNKQTKK